MLDIYDARRLDNDYSMCTADVCPVGALETKDFHHKHARVVSRGDRQRLRRLRQRLQHHGVELSQPNLAADAAPQRCGQ